MKMKYVLLLSLVLICQIAANAQCSSGIFENYLVLDTNQSGNVYYDLQAATANPDYQNTNLGNYVLGTNNLILNGAENKIFKCGTANIVNGNLFYSVYPVGFPSLSFDSVQMVFKANLGGTFCGGQDQKWDRLNANINLLAGITLPGIYELAVATSADYADCGFGTHNANNAGAFYNATFTVLPNAAFAINQAVLSATKNVTGVQLNCLVTSDKFVKQYCIKKSVGNLKYATIFSSPILNKQIKEFSFVDNLQSSVTTNYKAEIELIDGEKIISNNITVSKELMGNKLIVYPNPASDFIQINSVLFAKNIAVKYQIINMQSQVVRMGTVSEFANKIDIQQLANGIYCVQLLDGKSIGVFCKK